MADNYLEKRYEEVFGRDGKTVRGVSLPRHQGLDTLLLRNRSYRGYRNDYKVHKIQMDAIVAVNGKIASGRNAQQLRFHIVNEASEADKVLSLIHLGGALSGIHLPLPGTEPRNFIVVCCLGNETPTIDIDLGISLQSMLLKAVEIGLGGIIIRNFDKNEMRCALGLELEPLAVVAIGKPAEKIELVDAHTGDNLGYYRRDGVHYVPKIVVEDLLV